MVPRRLIALTFTLLLLAALAGCTQKEPALKPRGTPKEDEPVENMLYKETWQGNVKGFSKGPVETDSQYSCWYIGQEICPLGDQDRWFWMWASGAPNKILLNLTWNATSDATKKLGLDVSYFQWTEDYFGYKQLDFKEGPSKLQMVLEPGPGKNLEGADFRVQVVLSADAGLVLDQPFNFELTSYKKS